MTSIGAGARVAERVRRRRPHAPRPRPGALHGPHPPKKKRRNEPPRWALKLMRLRGAKKVGALIGAMMCIALIVGVAGARVARQDVGYVGVVRNGGPLDARTIRQVLLPGAPLTWIGLFSEMPHQYPAATVSRTYTITGNAAVVTRPGVDVVTVPTKDGVQVGLEATVFLRFVGESNIAVLEKFDTNYGGRRFTGADGRSLHPWQGDNGFAAWLDVFFRPVLNYDLRRELGALQCAELVASCSLISRGSSFTTNNKKVPLADTDAIAARISKALERDMTATIGQPYFRDVRMRISHVTLPKNVQTAVDNAQAQFAAVNSAEAELKQAKYKAEGNKLIGDSLNRSPGLATIEAMKAIPKGSTVIVSPDGKAPSILATTGGGATTPAPAGG
jgi:regulator of protease activity HflC (stomatin/prohibitin superfamily)